MKKWIWLLILNLFIAAPAFAAGTLTAKLNRNPVPVGETFVLSLEYEGDPGQRKTGFFAAQPRFYRLYGVQFL